MSAPSYLLSLSVENIRCFGPEQTLSLEREDGSPAMWTVLLGENGVGKTTLLQLVDALALIEKPKDEPWRPGELAYRVQNRRLNYNWLLGQTKHNRNPSHVSIRYVGIEQLISLFDRTKTKITQKPIKKLSKRPNFCQNTPKTILFDSISA